MKRRNAVSSLAVLILIGLQVGGCQVPQEPNACVDGAVDSSSCGVYGHGVTTRTCSGGAWSDPNPCADPDVCVDGQVQETSCGLGTHSRQCVGERWGEYGACDAPPSLTIAAPGRKDMILDAARHRLYISTSDPSDPSAATGEVRVFDMKTRQFEAPLLTGGAFQGMDLSPDGNQLLVADHLTDGFRNWVYRIDLTTGAVKRIDFNRDSAEGGTFTVAFTSNTEALVAPEFKLYGDVPLRRVNLTTGAAVPVASMESSAVLLPSADGSTVAYVLSGISTGEFGRYLVGPRTFSHTTNGNYTYDIAVNRTGSQYAVPTYEGLSIYDGAFALQRVLGEYAERVAIGAVYSPVADELYLAWAGGKTTTSIDVYDATTFQKLRDIQPYRGQFTWPGNGTFVEGRMRVSRDGAALFVTAGDNVVAYPTGR